MPARPPRSRAFDPQTLDPRVMAVIETLDYRATVGDVAAQAGLDLVTAERGLMALAAATGGHLQVSTAGEVIYQLERQFRTRLLQRFWQLRLEAALRTLWRACFFLVRLSFGLMLLALLALVSIAIIVAVVAAIAAALSGDGDGDVDFDGCGDGCGSSTGSGCGDGLSLVLDLLWWGDWGDRPQRPRSTSHAKFKSKAKGKGKGKGKNQGKGKDNSKSGDDQGNEGDQGPTEDPRPSFLESIYRFLFGCGNPNPHLEDRRWQLIGGVIRASGGAIAAEQIAPFLDDISPQQQESEDYMLPVLLRFDGHPEVSDRGDLIYRFPALQITAQGRKSSSLTNKSLAKSTKPATKTSPPGFEDRPTTAAAAAADLPTYLEEQPWRFSDAPTTAPLTLGIVLWSLSLVLKALLANHAVTLEGLVWAMDGLFWIAFSYSSAFLLIPAVRAIALHYRNRAIAARNRQRLGRATALRKASRPLRQKLTFAQRFAQLTEVKDSDLAYSSDRDLLEQEIDQNLGPLPPKEPDSSDPDIPRDRNDSP
ncbi:MAG: hypothetical protein Fur0042_30300 [Cyanophyceae cyanobacterium]